MPEPTTSARELSRRTVALDVSRWVLLAVVPVATAAAIVLDDDGRLALAGIAVWLTVTALTGFVLAGRVRANPIGWLLLALAALVATQLAAAGYADWRATSGSSDAPLVRAATWLSAWIAIPAFGLFGYVLLLFPTGRPPSPRWRPVRWVGAVALAGIGASAALMPGIVDGVGLPNPWGLPGAGAALRTVGDASETLAAVFGVLVLLSVLVRFRGSAGDERQQLRWLGSATVLLALGASFALAAEGALNDLSFAAALLGMTAVPVSIGVAVTRYRLYELGTLVNRAVVYTALSLTVTGLYVGTVVGVGTVFDRAAGLAASLLATLLVAMGFQPLRQRVQHLVDRALYGERRDPYGVLTGLTRRLRDTPDPTVVPELVVTTLTRTLGLSYAAIEMDHSDGALTVAERGQAPAEAEQQRQPLVYQGEVVGHLVYARLSRAAERQTGTLLADLAGQVAPALQALRLNRALQRSRERLVLAREEERRRLRGDLHDSLGPELAGLTLGLEAAENLLSSDPEAAAVALALLRERARDAVGTVRSVVDGLRPPALDHLGLVESVRQRTATLTAPAAATVTVTASGDLDGLPAAVEVAAYHIAVEAVTNAVRHAGASTITVAITGGQRLEVRVSDDGGGMPASSRDGAYGLVSMRERAAELGGFLRVDSGETGTTVTAELPVRRSVGS